MYHRLMFEFWEVRGVTLFDNSICIHLTEDSDELVKNKIKSMFTAEEQMHISWKK